MSIDAAQETGRGRAWREAPPVLDERFVERHERIEDHRPAPRDSLRGGHVEVAGIAHDQASKRVRRLPSRSRASAKAILATAPSPSDHLCRCFSQTLSVPLDDLDSGAAEAGDHLRVPRVVALVRPEVENASDSAQDLVHVQLGRPAAAGALFVVAGDRAR